MSYAMINRWSVSLLGYVTDLNVRLDGQVHNDYFDQFNIDQVRYTLILGGLLLLFVVGSIFARSSRRTFAEAPSA